jgi:hypothetical protein
VRRNFDVLDSGVEQLLLYLRNDDDVEVYINGEKRGMQLLDPGLLRNMNCLHQSQAASVNVCYAWHQHRG